jgi:hypothetical protein
MNHQRWRKLRKLEPASEEISLKTKIRSEKYTMKIYYELYNRLKDLRIYAVKKNPDDHTKINNIPQTIDDIVGEIFQTMIILSNFDTLRKERRNYFTTNDGNINQLKKLCHKKKPSITRNFYNRFIAVSIKNQEINLEPFQRINRLREILENPEHDLNNNQLRLIKDLYNF